MTEFDLFGEPIIELETKRHSTLRRGYARRPGTGPKGQTCRSCEHAMRISGYRKTFYKCACARPAWTHGLATDIKLSSPACLLWTQRYQLER